MDSPEVAKLGEALKRVFAHKPTGAPVPEPTPADLRRRYKMDEGGAVAPSPDDDD